MDALAPLSSFPLPTSNPAPPARRKVLAIDAQYAKRAAI